MESIKSLILIILLILLSIITSDSLLKLYNPSSKNVVMLVLLVIFGYIFTSILMIEIASINYPQRYDRLWGIMSFIFFLLYSIIISDRKITKTEFLGIIITFIGMFIIYSEN